MDKITIDEKELCTTTKATLMRLRAFEALGYEPDELADIVGFCESLGLMVCDEEMRR